MSGTWTSDYYEEVVRETRNKAIEECARVADKYDHEYRSNVAAAIRSLKNKP